MLDVLRSEVITYASDKSGKFTEAPATGDLAERVKQLHSQLIEFIAESDDALMEKFFAAGRPVRGGNARRPARRRSRSRSSSRCSCTSAENNIGVARLMDFIAKYGSSPGGPRPRSKPSTLDGKEVELSLDGSRTRCSYVFKTMSEAQFGELSFFRDLFRLGQVRHRTLQHRPPQHGEDRPDLPA